MTKQRNTESERLNPCLQEQEKSYECLNKNGYDQTLCQPYFDNYNVCKKFWGKVYRDRKAKGLHPYLPDVEERQKIKDEFFGYVKSNTN